MNLEHLNTFFVSANAGSLEAAAKILKMSVPTVSRHISLLEEDLGTELYVKAGRSKVLTLKGELLRRYAKGLLDEAEALKTQLKNEEDAPEGNLLISTTKALASTWMVDFVKPYLQKHPEMRLSIVGDNKLLDVLHREADAVVGGYISNAPDLVQDYIMSWNARLFASKEYLKQFGVPQTVKDLDHHRLITYGEHIALSYNQINWLLTEGVEKGQPRKPFFSINSIHAIAEAARDGLGIAALAKESRLPSLYELVPILPDVHGPSVDIFYIYRKEHRGSKRITSFKDFIIEHIPAKFRKL